MSKSGEDEEALWSKAVIQQNHRWLWAYLYSATGDRHLAEDLVQQTFAVAYEKRGTFKAELSFGAWLRGIARNILRRESEASTRRPQVVSVETLEQLEPQCAKLESRLVDQEYDRQRSEALKKCLSKQDDKAREVLELRYRNGLALAAIAQRTGLSLSAVGVTAFRTRAALAECIRRSLSSSGGVLR